MVANNEEVELEMRSACLKRRTLLTLLKIRTFIVNIIKRGRAGLKENSVKNMTTALNGDQFSNQNIVKKRTLLIKRTALKDRS